MQVIIKIPRFSFWHEEYEVYKHVSLFVYLSYKLKHAHCTRGKHQGPVTILKEMSNIQDIPYKDISKLFECLKDAAFAYKQPEHRFLKELSSNNLFSGGDYNRLETQKSEVKRLRKQHTELMVNLMDCQEKCWKSRDKMKEIVRMLECAEMSLPYYVDYEQIYAVRKYAVKKLKKDVTYRQKAHSKNVGEYHTILTQEQDIRQEMIEIAKKMEKFMVGRMWDRITQSWTGLCSATDPTKFRQVLDPGLMSKSLYNITCKTYNFIIPSNDISSDDFNLKIQRPRLQDSVYSYTEFTFRTFGGSYNRDCIMREDAEQLPDYFLKLKKGDRMRLKMMSSDGLVGFGYYKQSKLTAKKWGFVHMFSILIDNPYAK